MGPVGGGGAPTRMQRHRYAPPPPPWGLRRALTCCAAQWTLTGQQRLPSPPRACPGLPDHLPPLLTYKLPHWPPRGFSP